MKILISGISGFIGQNLGEYLKSFNYQIDSITRHKIKNSFVVNSYTWDELESIETQYNSVIHLAGIAHDIQGKFTKEDYFDVNCYLTCRFYDWFRSSQKGCFFYFSSVKAASDGHEGYLKEADKPIPGGLYGQSKLCAEEHILDNMPTHKMIYIIRPAMVHGPGNKGNLNRLFLYTQTSWPYPLGAFKNKRSFLSIGNLNYAIHEIIKKKIPSGIYHLADSSEISTTEIVKLMYHLQKKNPKIINVSPKFINLGIKLLLPLKPGISKSFKKMTENYLVSNQKIIKQIGNLPYTSQQGLELTIKSF